MNTLRTQAFNGIALAAAALALCAAVPAQALVLLDTGTPNGSIIGAYALDSNDAYAARIDLTGALQLGTVAAHMLGVTAGETFTLALYSNSALGAPGDLMQSATVSAVGDGWNAASGLGWSLTGGSYWLAIEVQATDTLGQGSLTGALLDRGTSLPLAHTAFNSGSGYTAAVLDFGLQVSAVPEAGSLWLLSAGLCGLAWRRRWAATARA